MTLTGESDYRGRLAPSPTGLLHLGHARTFLSAHLRAREANGVLVLRNEDLDTQRSRPEFVSAMFEDLHWASNGRRDQMSVDAMLLTTRASATNTISLPGAPSLNVATSIPAAARAKTSPPWPALRMTMKVTMSRTIPVPAVRRASLKAPAKDERPPE